MNEPDNLGGPDEDARRVGEGLLVERAHVLRVVGVVVVGIAEADDVDGRPLEGVEACRSGRADPSVWFRMCSGNSSPASGRSPATPRSSFATSTIASFVLSDCTGATT